MACIACGQFHSPAHPHRTGITSNPDATTSPTPGAASLPAPLLLPSGIADAAGCDTVGSGTSGSVALYRPTTNSAAAPIYRPKYPACTFVLFPLSQNSSPASHHSLITGVYGSQLAMSFRGKSCNNS